MESIGFFLFAMITSYAVIPKLEKFGENYLSDSDLEKALHIIDRELWSKNPDQMIYNYQKTTLKAKEVRVPRVEIVGIGQLDAEALGLDVGLADRAQLLHQPARGHRRAHWPHAGGHVVGNHGCRRVL